MLVRGTPTLARGSYYISGISDTPNSPRYTAHAESPFSEYPLSETRTMLEVHLEILGSGKRLLAQLQLKVAGSPIICIQLRVPFLPDVVGAIRPFYGEALPNTAEDSGYFTQHLKQLLRDDL